MADAENNNQPKDDSEQLEKFDINEYETQFFGFTPKSFMDGVYNAISDYVSECFGELEKQLASEPSFTQNCTPEQIHQKCDAMLTRFYKSLDNSFDRLEIYLLTRVFEIPPQVLLPEDKIHEGHNYTKEDEDKIDKEILELEKKIKAAKYVNTALKQEIKELDVVESKIADCHTYLDKLDKICCSGLGLKESIKFNYEKSMKMHDLINELQGGTVFPVEKSQHDSTSTSARKKIKIG